MTTTTGSSSLRRTLTQKATDTPLLTYLDPISGSGIGSGTNSVDVSIYQGLSTEVLATVSINVTTHDTEQGTDGSDPRWKPGVNGLGGFNVELVLPGAQIPDSGTYTLVFDVAVTGGTKKVSWQVAAA